jgi:DNA-binding transcriptional MerR regulator
LSGLLQIGDVAERTGLTADAIRFYERERLLHAATRSSGGFRLFSGSDVEDLNFIRNAQELGFSLDEIRELLGLKHTSHSDCRVVEELIEHKLEIVRGKIASLRKLERELRQAAAECKFNLDHTTNGQAESCPVLDDIFRRGRRNKK